MTKRSWTPRHEAGRDLTPADIERLAEAFRLLLAWDTARRARDVSRDNRGALRSGHTGPRGTTDPPRAA